MTQLLTIHQDDLQQHVIKYGMDIFPPPEFRQELVRTNELFRRLHEEWPNLYQEMAFNPDANQLRVLSGFSAGSATFKIPTLEFTPRGPVFSFPIRFPEVGSVSYGERKSDKDIREYLDGAVLGSLKQIRYQFPRTDVLRFGVVREAVFGTGNEESSTWLSSRFARFPGTTPKGGQVILTYRDDICNVQVSIATVQVTVERSTPTVKRTDNISYGVQVSLDVNNIEMRPQEPHEIERTIERAHSLWPKSLLEFLNGSSGHGT